MRMGNHFTAITAIILSGATMAHVPVRRNARRCGVLRHGGLRYGVLRYGMLRREGMRRA